MLKTTHQFMADLQQWRSEGAEDWAVSEICKEFARILHHPGTVARSISGQDVFLPPALGSLPALPRIHFRSWGWGWCIPPLYSVMSSFPHSMLRDVWQKHHNNTHELQNIALVASSESDQEQHSDIASDLSVGNIAILPINIRHLCTLLYQTLANL